MRRCNRLAAAALAGCVVAAVVAVTVSASPGYLLAQRVGQSFQYEARYDSTSTTNSDQLLHNESLTSYPYVFTADMNTLIKRIFATNVMGPLAWNIPLTNFTGCDYMSPPHWPAMVFRVLGCYKTLLHTGIASDCVAANPLCCVQYWRYPASLPKYLPTDQIDPRLIFWDGTQAANGFFTNFSDSYRHHFPNCSSFQVGPLLASPAESKNVNLAVDAEGEWRYVTGGPPLVSLVERRLATLNSSQQNTMTLLNGTASPVWAASHRFGDVPLAVPIIVAAALVGVLLLMLLLMYLCAYRPEQREAEVLRMKIEDVEEETAKAEAALAARRAMLSERRRRSSGGDARSQCTPSPPSKSQRGSFVGPQKLSPSPIGPNRSPHMMTPPTQQKQQQYVVAAAPHRASSSVGLSRHNSQVQAQRSGSFVSARNRMGPEHRRAPSRNSSVRDLPSDAAFVSTAAAGGGGGMRRHPSSSSMRSRRSSQDYENPLVGRQNVDL